MRKEDLDMFKFFESLFSQKVLEMCTLFSGQSSIITFVSFRLFYSWLFFQWMFNCRKTHAHLDRHPSSLVIIYLNAHLGDFTEWSMCYHFKGMHLCFKLSQNPVKNITDPQAYTKALLAAVRLCQLFWLRSATVLQRACLFSSFFFFFRRTTTKCIGKLSKTLHVRLSLLLVRISNHWGLQSSSVDGYTTDWGLCKFPLVISWHPK